MQYTSAEANKLLKRLTEARDALLSKEQQSKEFLASVGEDPETVRPAYDYAAVQAELAALEEKMRRVKHTISVFNTTHTVPGFDMTVDQLLVYIPQLSARKAKLALMADRLPKVREKAYGASAIIDYNYANYDIALVSNDYAAVSELLSKAQTALDVLNSTEIMEIDI